MVNTMSEKKKRVKLKPEEFVSQHDKIEEGVVHTRLRNKDGRWLDMFDYVPEGIGVDRLTNDGTKTTKKEEKIFTISDLNNMLVDGNKVKQQKIDLMKESEVSDEAYNLMPRKEFINAQNRAAEMSSQPQPKTETVENTTIDLKDANQKYHNPHDSDEVNERIMNDFDNFVSESKARTKNMMLAKKAHPEATPEELKIKFLEKRARKMKTQFDQQEYDKFDKEGKLKDLPITNSFHPEYINPHAEKEKEETAQPEPQPQSEDISKDGSTNPGGLQVAMRPKLAVNIMRIQFPEDVMSEINEHIDNTIIPANKDYSKGLVGQISHDKRSAQLHFPHNDDGVGKQFSDVITRLGSEYIDRVVGIRSDIEMQSMWTVHSYEGDYNPVHDHGTKTPMGLSCILYLKVPPQIEKLGNPAEHFEGLNESSGAVDGFTYLTWGVNGMRDINILRPITEEYVKPEVGTMLMFPAWLRHGVMPFFGDGERRTFSCNMNVSPTEKLSGDHYRKTREE
mgnify:FL=1